MPRAAPTLETVRLVIAPLEAVRFDEHAANMSDPRVVRWLGLSGPQERIEAWRRFCQGAGMWSLIGYGYWGVIERATDRLVGLGGLARFERGMAQLEGLPEAGWAFAHDAWGRGIASEFLAAVLAWADATLDEPEIRCIIAPENGASIRVAEKNGFALIDHAADAYGPVSVYARVTPPAPSPAG
jgi:RimJ/RimL family protein N-acetyltransferase